MKRLIDNKCSVGEFVVLYKDPDGGIGMAGRSTFPDYASAEHMARTRASEGLNRRVFIAQISGELVSVQHVYEVHGGGLLEAPKVA